MVPDIICAPIAPAEASITVLRISPNLATKVQALAHKPTLLPYRYSDVQLDQCFQQRIVLLGDAAHAMSPQLGLGAGLALFDAWQLTQHLIRLPMALALPEFERSRRTHVQRIQSISRIATPLFQSAHWLIAALREPLFRLVGNSRMQAIALDVLRASGLPPQK